MLERAIFFDRDDTLIEDPGYIASPDDVRLKPGAAAAVRSLRDAGFRIVIATNQSGIARGKFDEATLARIHDRMRELFADEQAVIDGIYYCPFLDGDDAVIEQYRQPSELRKPAPGMMLKAAREMGLDLSLSWAVGDSDRDVHAGRSAGCRTILIASNGDAADCEPDFVVDDLRSAADTLLANVVPVSPMGGHTTMSEKDLLAEILHAIRAQTRREQVREFSLPWLMFVVVQVLALTFGFWAMYNLIGQNINVAVPWFFFAIFLQLWSLTLAVISKRN